MNSPAIPPLAASTLRTRLLVVEDDEALRDDLVAFLSPMSTEVRQAGNAMETLQRLRESPVDIVILDLGLPDLDGIPLAAALRAAQEDLGIIMVTARGALPDRRAGRQSGADAYLVKPVDLEELQLTVENLARRLGLGPRRESVDLPPPAASTATSAAHPPWRLQAQGRVLLAPEGQRLQLTQGEYRFLSALVEADGRPVPRETLALQLGKAQASAARNLDILVSRLRAKAKDQGLPELPVGTVHGVGYAHLQPVVAIP